MSYKNFPTTEVQFDKHDNSLNGNAWMVRPCEWYKEEFKDCKSIRARFQQHFIDGQRRDCSDWKRDYDNCIRYRRNHKDLDSLNKVIESEVERKEKRIQSIRDNNVWEYRKEPPKDWNRPLPEWLVRRNRISSLGYVQEKLKEREKQNLEN